MRVGWILGMVLCVSACELSLPAPETAPKSNVNTPKAAGAGMSTKSFSLVVARIEPVAEKMCRARQPRANCDFKIVVDARKGQPSNAYQTLDKSGRPIIAFTTALIADARNQDELAFVLGHEAAHHISGHIARSQQTAVVGALLGGVLASIAGADSSLVEVAQQRGAQVGSLIYSKDHELEADSLGTVIAYRAGFDPERGAVFFTRIPDPGDRFLGSHPPNSSRIQTVRQTLNRLKKS